MRNENWKEVQIGKFIAILTNPETGFVDDC